MTTPSQRQQLSPHYATLTTAAENYIRSLRVAPESADDPEAAVIRRHIAMGVWLFWNDLTTGWQQDGDYERLEALIDAGDYDRLETAP